MKIKLLSALLTCLMLTACSNAEKVEPDSAPPNTSEYTHTGSVASDINTITDKQSGCQYIFSEGTYRSTMTPRLNPDGKTIRGCSDQKK